MTTTLFRTPALDLEDLGTLSDIAKTRSFLAAHLRTPKRWSGGLRRTSQARAIQGSNTIEGYTVTDQDAVAAVDDEAPLTADQATWAEILGYRRVLTYVLHMATGDDFVLDAQALRSMHFMLLEHELAKGPGHFRPGAIYVTDGDATVYEGPDASLVPVLVEALATQLSSTPDEPMTAAAMAHLDLVMIHPFKDGNGRMARALQTLVMAREKVVEPTFSSIEEWLGANSDDYYRILALTGGGGWHPERDAHLWLKFNLRAHHMQAQTHRRRFQEAERTWTGLDELVARHRLPDRVAEPLFDAVLGLRVRRPTYVKQSHIEERTATRDLNQLVSAGLLDGQGNTRGRFYVAGPELRDLAGRLRSERAPLVDPYPWLPAELRSRVA